MFPYSPSEPKLRSHFSTTRRCNQVQKHSDRFSRGHVRDPARLALGSLDPYCRMISPTTYHAELKSKPKEKWEMLNCKPMITTTNEIVLRRRSLPDTVRQMGLVDSVDGLSLRKPAETEDPGVPSRAR